MAKGDELRKMTPRERAAQRPLPDGIVHRPFDRETRWLNLSTLSDQQKRAEWVRIKREDPALAAVLKDQQFKSFADDMARAFNATIHIKNNEGGNQ